MTKKSHNNQKTYKQIPLSNSKTASSKEGEKKMEDSEGILGKYNLLDFLKKKTFRQPRRDYTFYEGTFEFFNPEWRDGKSAGTDETLDAMLKTKPVLNKEEIAREACIQLIENKFSYLREKCQYQPFFREEYKTHTDYDVTLAQISKELKQTFKELRDNAEDVTTKKIFDSYYRTAHLQLSNKTARAERIEEERLLDVLNATPAERKMIRESGKAGKRKKTECREEKALYLNLLFSDRVNTLVEQNKESTKTDLETKLYALADAMKPVSLNATVSSYHHFVTQVLGTLESREPKMREIVAKDPVREGVGDQQQRLLVPVQRDPNNGYRVVKSVELGILEEDFFKSVPEPRESERLEDIFPEMRPNNARYKPRAWYTQAVAATVSFATLATSVVAGMYTLITESQNLQQGLKLFTRDITQREQFVEIRGLTEEEKAEAIKTLARSSPEEIGEYRTEKEYDRSVVPRAQKKKSIYGTMERSDRDSETERVYKLKPHDRMYSLGIEVPKFSDYQLLDLQVTTMIGVSDYTRRLPEQRRPDTLVLFRF